ncbi:MAG TPA: universal stress protein [Candidatus Limnocylindria bacterium]|nr:universal stress protein [Candidatus Limnocylindria bacterium]
MLVSAAAMISTIAVGTDGSATASKAVDVAAEMARRFDARLVLMSVYREAKGTPRGADPELQWATNPAARMREILDRTAEKLGGAGIECTTLAHEGDPAGTLVELAKECDADLLVIGNKGMDRRILGSVPNTVAHRAPCSVLVVKTT